MGLRVVSRRDAFSPEGGAFGWGFRKNSFAEGDSHRDIVFADGLCGLNSAENAVLKPTRSLVRKPPVTIASELTRVACASFAKPQVAGLHC